MVGHSPLDRLFEIKRLRSIPETSGALCNTCTVSNTNSERITVSCCIDFALWLCDVVPYSSVVAVTCSSLCHLFYLLSPVLPTVTLKMQNTCRGSPHARGASASTSRWACRRCLPGVTISNDASGNTTNWSSLLDQFLPPLHESNTEVGVSDGATPAE